MLRSRLDYLGLHGRLRFDGDGDGKGGGNPPEPEQKPKEEQKPVDPLEGLTEDQQKAIQKKVDAAAAAARKQGKTEAEQAVEARRVEEEESKKIADKVAAGEFETVKTELEGKAKTAEDKLNRANEVLSGVIADRVKALEETGDKELLEAFPKDAEPLEQLAWLNDPRTKRAIAAATEDKKVVDAQGKPKVPKTPKPNGDGEKDDEEARKRFASRYQ